MVFNCFYHVHIIAPNKFLTYFCNQVLSLQLLFFPYLSTFLPNLEKIEIMIILCLSVVMAALFITVLNSKTARTITLRDNPSNQIESS